MEFGYIDDDLEAQQKQARLQRLPPYSANDDELAPRASWPRRALRTVVRLFAVSITLGLLGSLAGAALVDGVLEGLTGGFVVGVVAGLYFDVKRTIRADAADALLDDD